MWVKILGIIMAFALAISGSIYGTTIYHKRIQEKQKISNTALFDKLYSCTTETTDHKGQHCNQKTCVSRYTDTVFVTLAMCCRTDNKSICGMSLSGNARVAFDLLSTIPQVPIE
jgi:hypothetical protein